MPSSGYGRELETALFVYPDDAYAHPGHDAQQEWGDDGGEDEHSDFAVIHVRTCPGRVVYVVLPSGWYFLRGPVGVAVCYLSPVHLWGLSGTAWSFG